MNKNPTMRRAAVLVAFLALTFHTQLLFAGIVEGTCDQPYAQLPNGCSGPWGTSEVRDDWKAFDFGPACDEHDKCYYTLGTTARECNRAFKDALRAECEEMDGTERFFNYWNCRSIAKVMTEAVEANEDKYFGEAQAKQREFENSCQAECDVDYGYMKINTNLDPATNKDYRYVYFSKVPGRECVFRGLNIELPFVSELEDSDANSVVIYGYGNRLGEMTVKAFVGVTSEKINDYRYRVNLGRVGLSSSTNVEQLETTLPVEIEGETLFYIDFLGRTLDLYPYL